MYASLAIENFRCFDNLTVEPLARVNLIAGPNNVGKTALLEALWMLSHPTAPLDALRIATRRDPNDYMEGELFAGLFPRYDTDAVIKLQSAGGHKLGAGTLSICRKERSRQSAVDWAAFPETESVEDALSGFDFNSELVFTYADEAGGKFTSSAWLDVDSRLSDLRPTLSGDRKSAANAGIPCLFERPGYRPSARTLSARFGKAEMAGYLPDVEKIVRLLEPRLKRMTTIANTRGYPSIYGDISAGRLFPIAAMGEGTKRLLALSLAFLSAQNGVLLVDEIENGLHYGALVDVWKSLDWLSREFNVQVFATTHSYECIKAAHTASKASGVRNDLALFRLQRNYRTQQIESVAYDDAEAFDYAMDYELEVR